MNLQELEKILSHAKSLGASEFECTDANSSLKVKFASNQSIPMNQAVSVFTVPGTEQKVTPPTPMTDEELKKLFRDPSADSMTDEKILYYATPYYDEILAKEEEHKKKLEEERI